MNHTNIVFYIAKPKVFASSYPSGISWDVSASNESNFEFYSCPLFESCFKLLSYTPREISTDVVY